MTNLTEGGALLEGVFCGLGVFDGNVDKDIEDVDLDSDMLDMISRNDILSNSSESVGNIIDSSFPF